MAARQHAKNRKNGLMDSRISAGGPEFLFSLVQQLFGVQVVTNDGSDVSGRRAIGRTLAFPLSFLILCLGFLGILLDDQRRALHDVIAGTTVIYCWDARAARLRMLSRPRYSTPHAPPESPSLPEPPSPSEPPSLPDSPGQAGPSGDLDQAG